MFRRSSSAALAGLFVLVAAVVDAARPVLVAAGHNGCC